MRRRAAGVATRWVLVRFVAVIVAVLAVSFEPGLRADEVSAEAVEPNVVYHHSIARPIDVDVGPLAAFVEAETGWEFTEELPPIEWETPYPLDDEYDDPTDGDPWDPLPNEQPAVMRALGPITALPSRSGLPGDVAPGDPPPLADDRADSAARNATYWRWFDERITVYDAPRPVPADWLEQALVHELTHAIRDDRDLGPWAGDFYAGIDYGAAPTADEWWVDAAFSEGQAGVVEGAWYWAQRPGHEMTFDLRYRDGYRDTPAEEMGQLAVSAHQAGTWFFSLFAWLPIGLTPSEVADSLPDSSDAILNPEAYLLGDVAEQTPEPDVPSGYEILPGGGELSARRVWSMLAPVIDVEQARRAIAGWGGSTSWVVQAPNETQCVTATIVGDDPADTDALHDALAAWIDTTGHPDAQVSHVDDHLRFWACDPGGDGLLVVRDFDQLHALNRELFHAVHVLRWLTDEPATPERWACLIPTAGDAVPADVLADWTPLDPDEAMPLAQQVASTCDGAGAGADPAAN